MKKEDIAAEVFVDVPPILGQFGPYFLRNKPSAKDEILDRLRKAIEVKPVRLDCRRRPSLTPHFENGFAQEAADVGKYYSKHSNHVDLQGPLWAREPKNRWS